MVEQAPPTFTAAHGHVAVAVAVHAHGHVAVAVHAHVWGQRHRTRSRSFLSTRVNRARAALGAVASHHLRTHLAKVGLDGHHVTMKRQPKTVKIAELKAHLSRYLREVRAGQEIVINDRDQPIAKVVPFEAARKPLLQMTKAKSPGGSGKLKFERLLKPGIDPLEFLQADRRKDRSR